MSAAVMEELGQRSIALYPQMKAAVYTLYGPPDVVQITEVEKPVPNDYEVLIKVRAASVNPLDWHFMRGLPYPIRLMAGCANLRSHKSAWMWQPPAARAQNRDCGRSVNR